MNDKTAKELVETLVREAVDKTVLNESIKEDVKFSFNGKEIEFGSPEHVKIMSYMLHGLQSLRDCYHVGSANRHVYATACHKLRKLIAKHSPSQ
jgi:hypothetical protein